MNTLLFRTMMVGLGLGSVACVAQKDATDDGLSSSDAIVAEDTAEESTQPKKSTRTAVAPSSSTDTSDAPTTARSDSAPSKPTLKLTVSFAEGAGEDVARTCTDNGTENSQASFFDATGYALVPVNAPNEEIGKVTDPSKIDAMKQAMLADGTLTLEVDEDAVGTTPAKYALVALGDGFGTPANCGGKLKMESTDAEKFPEGSGVIGFVEAHKSGDKIEAQAISELVLAASDEESGGSKSWSNTPKGYGCDRYDSPLVLDLSGKGISLGGKTRFDIDGDGAADPLSWVSSEDTPFLALDRNGNGLVDGIDELFGNRTGAGLGERNANGFDALARFDLNGDGVIDNADPVFSQLRLWFDRNHDGKTDAGELVSLGSRGVRSLSLGYRDVQEGLFVRGRQEGMIRQRSSAMANGTSVALVDVWFRR